MNIAMIRSSSVPLPGVSWHVAFDMRPVHARALAVFAHHASFSWLVSLPKILRGWNDCVRGVLIFQRLSILNWGGDGIDDVSGRRSSFLCDASIWRNAGRGSANYNAVSKIMRSTPIQGEEMENKRQHKVIFAIVCLIAVGILVVVTLAYTGVVSIKHCSFYRLEMGFLELPGIGRHYRSHLRCSIRFQPQRDQRKAMGGGQSGVLLDLRREQTK